VSEPDAPAEARFANSSLKDIARTILFAVFADSACLDHDAIGN
jgi:hypothetical protein